jgi:hypothetical protein
MKQSILNYLLFPFGWSRWVDLTTFHFGSGYLLQGKKNKYSNAKKFRVIKMKQLFGFPSTPNLPLDFLTKAGLTETELKD